MLNCIYHPTQNMRVVEDNEKDELIASGAWFNTPNEAKNMRAEYEKRILDGEKPRKRKSKRTAEDVREGPQI